MRFLFASVCYFLQKTFLFQLFQPSNSCTKASPIKKLDELQGIELQTSEGAGLIAQVQLPASLRFLWPRSKCGQTVATHAG